MLAASALGDPARIMLEPAAWATVEAGGGRTSSVSQSNCLVVRVIWHFDQHSANPTNAGKAVLHVPSNRRQNYTLMSPVIEASPIRADAGCIARK